MVVMFAEVMFEEVTADASALYAAVRSVVCWVVGELVYSASNWLNSVALPVRVVPEAKAVTRPFSNDLSAESLLGERPSLWSVWKAARMAVNWPTVVLEASSIFWMSLWSVWRALVSAEFEELLVEPLELLVELVELLVELVELLAKALESVVEPVEPLVEPLELLDEPVCRCAIA
jgi:hypothetical protein